MPVEEQPALGFTQIPSPPPPPPNGPKLPTRFYGRTRLSRLRAVRDMSEIMDEVTTHLGSAGEDVTLTIEISAKSSGYGESTVRTARENAQQLGFEDISFED